jgi:CheY-like chemotaxis protein
MWLMAPPTDTAAPHSQLQVLLVEDDESCASTTAKLIGLYGHSVEVVSDGPSALQRVNADPPDVVLLDIALPGRMSGWEVAESIKKQISLKQPLLIAVTAFGTKEARQHSTRSGIDLHLTKPVDPSLLEDLLRRFRRIICD